MRSWKLCLAVLALAALLPTAAAAKKNDPNIPLSYAPTTAVAGSSAVPTSDMREISASILIRDDRGLDDPKVIGSRTDDDDNRIELMATGDVAEFVEASLIEQARRWSFAVAEQGEADLVLVGRLTQLEIEETNQAVGASYGADVTLEIELRDASGKAVWSGSASGDAGRFGKKFSRENTNEVLSDALAEALADALGDRALRAAWSGAPAGTATRRAEAARAESITPEEALREVEKLMRRDLEAIAIETYLRKQTLTRALGSDDLAAWKGAGVAESVLRTAMTLPVE